jgi:hypothetical protein
MGRIRAVHGVVAGSLEYYEYTALPDASPWTARIRRKVVWGKSEVP